MIFAKHIPLWRRVVATLGVTLFVLSIVLIASGESSDSKITASERDHSIWINQLLLMGVGGVFSFIAAWYWWQRSSQQKERDAIAADHIKTVERVRTLELELATVTAAVIPISQAYQAILIKELTHFHTPEMDALMKKIGPPNELTEAEDDRLFNMLLPQREKDMGPLISEAERDAAHILPAIVRRARVENQQIDTARSLKMKLVSIDAVVGIPAAVLAAEVSKPEK